MSYKINDNKNPVGPDEPAVKFNFPLWQVFIALFLVAIVVTAFKVYEKNVIAPQRVIELKPFILDEFQQARTARKNLLLFFEPTTENSGSINEVINSPNVRVAAWGARCVAFQLGAEVRTGEVSDWLSELLPSSGANTISSTEVDRGGFLFLGIDNKTPQWLALDDATPESLAYLIDGDSDLSNQ